MAYSKDGAPIYEDYRVPAELKPRHKSSGPKRIGWEEILDNWGLVVPDLAEIYGIDLYDPTLKDRSWPWLRDLLLGLLGTPGSRLARKLSA